MCDIRTNYFSDLTLGRKRGSYCKPQQPLEKWLSIYRLKSQLSGEVYYHSLSFNIVLFDRLKVPGKTGSGWLLALNRSFWPRAKELAPFLSWVHPLHR